MPINPLTGLNEEDEYSKLFAENDAKRNALAEQNSGYDTAGAIQGALASLAAGFQGKDSLGAVNNVMNQRRENKRLESEALDKWKQGKLAEIQAKRQGIQAGREDEKYAQEQEKMKRESDVASQDSIMAQQLASKMVPGRDFSKMSAKQINQLLPSLQKIYEVEQKKLDRGDARSAAAEARQDKIDAKIQEREAKLAVPGYTRDGSVLPKDEEAVKFRKATATADALSQKLNRMKDLVKEKGSFEYGGTAGTEMESLATEIQLLGKSPELYELGVLTGPDLSLLEKISSDPSSISSLFTRDSSRKTQIDSQLKSIEQKLGATAKSLGYQKSNTAQASQPTSKTVVKTQTNPKTGQKRVVYSDGTTELISSVAGGG